MRRLLLSSLLITVSSLAAAQPYASAGLAATWLKDAEFKDSGNFLTGPEFAERQTAQQGGLFGSIGYQFNPYFAIEGFGLYISSDKSSGTTIYGDEYEEESGATSYALLAVGKLPIYKGLSLFVKAGPSYNIVDKSLTLNNATENENDKFYDLAYGAGAEWYFSQHWGVAMQYLVTSTETSMAGLSVQFRL